MTDEDKAALLGSATKSLAWDLCAAAEYGRTRAPPINTSTEPSVSATDRTVSVAMTQPACRCRGRLVPSWAGEGELPPSSATPKPARPNRRGHNHETGHFTCYKNRTS
jgi:hypothetical protein